MWLPQLYYHTFSMSQNCRDKQAIYNSYMPMNVSFPYDQRSCLPVPHCMVYDLTWHGTIQEEILILLLNNSEEAKLHDMSVDTKSSREEEV